MPHPTVATIPFVTPPVRWNNGRHDVAMGIVPIGWLRPAPYNPRTMVDAARRKLEHGLDHFGLVDTLVAADDGELLGGHQRLTSELRRGADQVPVYVVVGLTAAERAAVNVLLNNPETQGQWDMGKLTAMLSELDAHGFDATLTGFDDTDLRRMLTTIPAAQADMQLAGGEGADGSAERSLSDAANPGGALDGDATIDVRQWGVTVVCADPASQEATYERLTAMGFLCQRLTA